MRLVTSQVNLEVKYKKVSAEQLVEKPEIVWMTADGKRIESKRVNDDGEILEREDDEGERVEAFHWKLFADGGEVKKKDVHFFECKDGEPVREVSPFKRTKEIHIVKEVPMASINGFLVETYYELYHKDDSIINALYQEAERYIKEDLAGIALFSWGNGFKQFYAVIYPILRDGHFVWIMKLTRTKLQYQHMMPLPTTKTPVKEPPKLESLPPIEALLVVK